MGRHRRTSSTNSADQLISRLDSDCARHSLHHWLSTNSTLHRRRSSLPGRRCSCLVEQSATARLFSSLRGRQPLDCLALRLPIGPNALPLINQLVIEISWWFLQPQESNPVCLFYVARFQKRNTEMQPAYISCGTAFAKKMKTCFLLFLAERT